MGVAEQGHGPLVADDRSVGPGDQLVEQRQGVAGRAASGAHDEREHTGLDRHALALAERLDVLQHRRGRHEPERVVMGPRPDRADDLLGLGRGEDELHMLRRFLDELQQGVEALRGDHVRLVQDEDLEPVARGREDRPLPQVAGVVDAVVGRGVDLHHVERAAAASTQFHTALTGAARGVGRALGAVQAAGEDARRRRLPASARAREEVGVTDPVAAQRGHERLGDLRLSDHLAERLGAIAAVQGCGHPNSLRRAPDIRSAGFPRPGRDRITARPRAPARRPQP